MVFKRVGELWKNVNPFAGSKREREAQPGPTDNSGGGDRQPQAKRSRKSDPGRSVVRPPHVPVPTKAEADRGVTRCGAMAKPPPRVDREEGVDRADAVGAGFFDGRNSVVRNRVEFGGRGGTKIAVQEEKTCTKPGFSFVPMERRGQDEGPSALLSPVQRLRLQNKDDALVRLANIGQQKKQASEGVNYPQVGYVPQEVTRSKASHHLAGGLYKTPPRKHLQTRHIDPAKPRPGPEKHRFSPAKLPPSVMASAAAFQFSGGETHGEEGSHRPSNSTTPRPAGFSGGGKSESEKLLVLLSRGVENQSQGVKNQSQGEKKRVSFLWERSKSPPPMGCVQGDNAGVGIEQRFRGGTGKPGVGRIHEVGASSSHRSPQQGPSLGNSEKGKKSEEEELELVNSFQSIDLRDRYSKHVKSARQMFGDLEIEREREIKSIRQSPGLSIHELEVMEKEADFAWATAVHATPTGKTPVQAWHEFQSSIKPLSQKEDDELSESLSEILTEDLIDQEEEQGEGVTSRLAAEEEGPRRFGVELTEEDYGVYEDVVERPDGRVLSEVDNVELTAKVLGCLQHGEWLNDEIMNGYMRLLQERDSRLRSNSGTAPRCHFHKSFFMNRLFLDENKYCYKNVQRWTKPQKLKNWGQQSQSILDCDIVFFPVHLHMHWVLAYALLGENKIVYCDSLQGKRPDVVQAICQYLKDEASDKKGERWDMGEWEHIYSKAIPRQKNGCDCGVFSLMYAKSRSEVSTWRDDWGFDQASMPELRIGMLKEFLAKKLL